MEYSNKDKAIHGKELQKDIGNLLEFCKNGGLIENYTHELRMDRVGFYAKQFRAPYGVEFCDGEKWAVFSSTSFKSDRIKGTQWDAFNIKEIDHDYKKCFLVFPDDIDETKREEFMRQNLKYLNRKEFSALDGLVSQAELVNLIEERGTKEKRRGVALDFLGRNFEKRVAFILQNKSNLLRLQGGARLIEGIHYDIYEKILKGMGIQAGDILSITAISGEKEIGKLPSGGNPKTDVLVTVKYKDGSVERKTISCKRTKSDWVSVHQYSAEVFAKVLDPNNEELFRLLQDFQKVGAEKYYGHEKTEKLTAALIPYREKLALWAIGGLFGPGEPETMWANYIVVYDASQNVVSIRSIHDYYQMLLDQGVKGQFGTIFKWTYASGQKGKSIQLKSKIIL